VRIPPWQFRPTASPSPSRRTEIETTTFFHTLIFFGLISYIQLHSGGGVHVLYTPGLYAHSACGSFCGRQPHSLHDII
jgi:hypothetical protein